MNDDEMDNGSKSLLPVLAGLAAGIAIGYYIALEDKGKFIENLIGAGRKIKSDLEKMQETGKQFVEDLQDKMNDPEDTK